MTFGVWHERDSGKAEADNFGDFLKGDRELKSEVRNATMFYNAWVPPKREIFLSNNNNIEWLVIVSDVNNDRHKTLL